MGFRVCDSHYLLASSWAWVNKGGRSLVGPLGGGYIALYVCAS